MSLCKAAQMTERYYQAKNITLIGALVNAVLGFFKSFGGVYVHSHGLIADGIHSFSDLIMDLMVLSAVKYGSQTADEKHPYGHQRIETAATLFLALLLIFAGAAIAWDAIYEIIYFATIRPSSFAFALSIALLSIAAKEALFHYTRHIGKVVNSSLIIANAWHHRSDAASSIVVAISLLGSMLGFKYLDSLAAVIIGLMIVKMGISYGWNSVKELIDTSVEPETLARITAIILAIPGVERVHQLRSRYMGNDILIDVHVLVAPFISVSEGHYIAQHVHLALMRQLWNVRDVTVHVDSEDDELTCPSYNLQNRQILQEEFLLQWQRDYPVLRNWTLHYLDGKLIIDLICNENEIQCQALCQHIKTEYTVTNLHKSKIKQIRLFTERRLL